MSATVQQKVEEDLSSEPKPKNLKRNFSEVRALEHDNSSDNLSGKKRQKQEVHTAVPKNQKMGLDDLEEAMQRDAESERI
jgi:hypothetical protein